MPIESSITCATDLGYSAAAQQGWRAQRRRRLLRVALEQRCSSILCGLTCLRPRIGQKSNNDFSLGGRSLDT